MIFFIISNVGHLFHRFLKYLAVGLIGSCTSLIAQTAAPEQDCLGALPVCDTLFIQPNAYTGFGLLNEISGASCIGTERNSVWYKIQIRANGVLAFELQPLRVSDDYDWTVFRLQPGETCADIRAGKALEVSCNFSDGKNFPVFMGRTGATGDSKETRQNNRGMPFNDKVPVREGETYYLVVTNFSASNIGYRLSFAASTPGIVGAAIQAQPRFSAVGRKMESQTQCVVPELTVRFSQYIRCSSLMPQNFFVRGENFTSRVLEVRSARCERNTGNFDSTLTLFLANPINTPGEYTVEAVMPMSDLCGNTINPGTPEARSAVMVTFPTFTASVSGATELCTGGSTTLDAGGGYTSYLWKLGTETISTEQTVLVSRVGTYSLVVRDKSGCLGTTATVVRLRTEPLQPTISGIPFFCAPSGSALLDAGAGFTDYRWSNGATTRTISVREAGVYSVTVNTAEGCSGSASVIVRQRTMPIIPVIQGALQFCAGTSTQLDAGVDPETGNNFDRYEWSLNGTVLPDNGRFITINRPGTLTVRVQTNGCEGLSAAVMLAQELLPQKPTIQRRGNVLIAPDAASYLWREVSGRSLTGNTTKEFSPPFSGTFECLVGNTAGCEAVSNPFAFTRINAVAEFAIGSVSAKPGLLVEIPILLQRASLLAESGATGFEAILSFNARLLLPIPDQQGVRDSIANLVRHVKLSLPLLAASGITLKTITATAMLGNTTATQLTLSSITSIPPGAVEINSGKPGEFTLTGVATEGSIRLIGEPGKITLNATPQPVHTELRLTLQTTERTPVRFGITNVLGEELHGILPKDLQKVYDEGRHEIAATISSLAPGVYYLTAQTPFFSATCSLVVIR